MLESRLIPGPAGALRCPLGVASGILSGSLAASQWRKQGRWRGVRIEKIVTRYCLHLRSSALPHHPVILPRNSGQCRVGCAAVEPVRCQLQTDTRQCTGARLRTSAPAPPRAESRGLSPGFATHRRSGARCAAGIHPGCYFVRRVGREHLVAWRHTLSMLFLLSNDKKITDDAVLEQICPAPGAAADRGWARSEGLT